MMEALDSSFDGRESLLDLTNIISASNDNYADDDIDVNKKLSTIFDSCIKPEDHMKVYLRVRPISSKLESTIIVDSNRSIITNAPESSKRAQYTKTEARHYVRKVTDC